jgi:hypothetical protein
MILDLVTDCLSMVFRLKWLHLHLMLRVTRTGKFGVWDAASNYCLEPEISEIQVRLMKH